MLVAPTDETLFFFKRHYDIVDLNINPGVTLLETHLGYRNDKTFTSLNGHKFPLTDPREIDELGFIDDNVPISREDFINVHVDIDKGILIAFVTGVLITAEQIRDWFPEP
jgi:hypothetical protein